LRERFSQAGTRKFSGKESKGGEVFFDHVCYTIDAFKMSLKRSESKEYSSHIPQFVVVLFTITLVQRSHNRELIDNTTELKSFLLRLNKD